MAETSKPKDEQNDTNPGTPDPSATASADVYVAEKAGLSEGDIKALRDDAGLNQSAGHDMDIHSWEATPAGQEFVKGERDRVKATEAEAKAFDAQTNKDGLNEFEAKYADAVKKASK
jgi:hypothetical protein